MEVCSSVTRVVGFEKKGGGEEVVKMAQLPAR